MATLLIRSENDITLAYFQDVRIIDESRISSLGQELTELINNAENNQIILNFQNVSFMSSAMIGKLVLFGKKCKSSNVDLRICGINPNIKEVFDLMKLEKIFKVSEDEAKAVAAFNKKGWFG